MNINIKWGSGDMVIYCEGFFPTTRDKLNVLLKTIDLDSEHKDEILHQILHYLEDLEQDAEKMMQEIKHQYGNEYQKMKDLEWLVDSGKQPNGVSLSKVQWEDAKAILKEQTKHVRGLERSLKKHSAVVKKAKSNAQIIIKKVGV